METVKKYLLEFSGKQGLYVIRPKSIALLKLMCEKLLYTYSSEIAYIGKAEITKSSDLGKRALS